VNFKKLLLEMKKFNKWIYSLTELIVRVAQKNSYGSYMVVSGSTPPPPIFWKPILVWNKNSWLLSKNKGHDLTTPPKKNPGTPLNSLNSRKFQYKVKNLQFKWKIMIFVFLTLEQFKMSTVTLILFVLLIPWYFIL